MVWQCNKTARRQDKRKMRLLSRLVGRLASRRAFSSSHRVVETRPPLLELHGEFVSLLKQHAPGSTGTVTMQTMGRVHEIVLANEPKRGAMDARMMLQLGAIIDGLLTQQQSDGVEQTGGIVLRGKGESFCAGLDLSLARAALNTPEKGILMSDYMSDALNRIRDSPYVSVCVINGPAVGGGMELLTATDYRVMLDAPRCKIQSVHARIGASPGWGGASRLAQLVGRRHALRLLGASLALDGKAALAMGLVDALAPEGGADESRPGLDFLQPFVKDSQYARSVAGIKYVLAAEGAPEEMAVREGEVFYERWFGDDNRQALDRAQKK